jgi:membrane-associated phospholipid phosphatase
MTDTSAQLDPVEPSPHGHLPMQNAVPARAALRRRGCGAGWSLIGAAAVVIAIAATGWLADAALARAAAALPPATVLFFAWVTKLGDSAYLLIGSSAATVLLAVRAWRRPETAAAAANAACRSGYFFVVIAASGVVAQLIKHCVGRARPSLMAQVGAFHFQFLSIKASLASFPSGHATTAFAAATAVSIFAPVMALPLFTAATLIAASRVAVGAHYLSDVLAGSVFGAACAVAIARVLARYALVFEVGAMGLVPRRSGLIAAWRRDIGLRRPQ